MKRVTETDIRALRSRAGRTPRPKSKVGIDGMNVPQQKRVTLLAFITAYTIICLLAFLVLIAVGIDNTKSVTIILSCIGNVGPSLSIDVGTSMSWATLPAAIKWMCMGLMLVGRLEIFSVLVIFTPTFWKES